jgi:hypothetical protein
VIDLHFPDAHRVVWFLANFHLVFWNVKHDGTPFSEQLPPRYQDISTSTIASRVFLGQMLTCR